MTSTSRRRRGSDSKRNLKKQKTLERGLKHLGLLRKPERKKRQKDSLKLQNKKKGDLQN
jgi:hypothetical protein